MANIKGTAGNDTLFGTDGNDVIDGLAGIDTMIGGYGSDRYYVDDFLDVVQEAVAEGTDTIYASVSYALPDQVENLVLTGKADLDGFGNIMDNSLQGNRGNNILDGGAGADTMNGGAGNDTYYINIFATDGRNYGRNYVGDVIIDSSGIDTVTVGGAGDPNDSWLYIMQKGLENADFSPILSHMSVTGNQSRNIIRTSDGDDTLKGEAGNDTLIAGAGDDFLDGGRGNDTMNGGSGKNTYVVDSRKDVIIEGFDDIDGVTGKPDDTVADTLLVRTNYVLAPGAHVEYITFDGPRGLAVTGSDTINIITGSVRKDTIRGGGGNDTIDGNGGRDIIYGDGGADTFKFSDSAFSGPVTIRDFNVAQGDRLDVADIIDYDGVSAISGFVEITDQGRNSIVKVMHEGKWAHIATLFGVTGLTGEADLVFGGNLIVEPLP